MKNRLNYEMLRFHILEARGELGRLIERLEFSMTDRAAEIDDRTKKYHERKISEGGLSVSLEHAYHHLNFAWNTRNMDWEHAESKFTRHEKFPRSFVCFWPRTRLVKGGR